MRCSEWIYIFAISLQLSGAALLIIKYCFISTEKAIKNNNEKKPNVNCEQLNLNNALQTDNEIKENIWLNRFAFVLIAIGYLIGVFGEIKSTSKCCILLIILIISTILVLVLYAVSNYLSK